MKTILLPTRFSAQAPERLASACRLAHQNGAQVIVLAAISLPTPDKYPTATLLNSYLNQKETELMELFIQLKDTLPDAMAEKLQLGFDMITTSMTESILIAARKYEPNAILLGNEIWDPGMQKVAVKKLIRKTTCPVLTLPAHVQVGVSPTLVYATNFRKEDRRIINKLLRFAEDFSARLHCIHIKQDQSRIDYAKVLPWEQFYRKDIDKGLISFEVIYQKDVLQHLDASWQKQDAGLWVQPFEGAQWWKKLFSSSSSSLRVMPMGSPVLALK